MPTELLHPAIESRLDEITNAFNSKTGKGIELINQICVDNSINPAQQTASFFYQQKNNLNAEKVADYISGPEPEHSNVRRAWTERIDLKGLSFIDGLRGYLQNFNKLPGEAQKIGRLMEDFGKAYVEQNPSTNIDKDTGLVLGFQAMMLNTDLHNPAIKKKMSFDELKRNTRGLSNGKDFDEKFLKNFYNDIKKESFKLNFSEANNSKPQPKPAAKAEEKTSQTPQNLQSLKSNNEQRSNELKVNKTSIDKKDNFSPPKLSFIDRVKKLFTGTRRSSQPLTSNTQRPKLSFMDRIKKLFTSTQRNVGTNSFPRPDPLATQKAQVPDRKSANVIEIKSDITFIPSPIPVKPPIEEHRTSQQETAQSWLKPNLQKSAEPSKIGTGEHRVSMAPSVQPPPTQQPIKPQLRADSASKPPPSPQLASSQNAINANSSQISANHTSTTPPTKTLGSNVGQLVKKFSPEPPPNHTTLSSNVKQHASIISKFNEKGAPAVTPTPHGKTPNPKEKSSVTR